MTKRLICMLLFCITAFAAAGCATKNTTAPAEKSSKDKPEANKKEELSASYYYLKSRIHVKNREYGKAISFLENAIKKDPDSFVLIQDLIQLQLKIGNEAKAISLAEKLAQDHPDNVDALLMLIQLKKDTMDEKTLVSLLNRILVLDPKNKTSFLRLGKIYFDNEDDANAKDLFQKMVKQFPEYYVAWYYLGQAYMKEKNYPLAEESFLKTIELEPELIEPRLKLIQIYDTKNSAANKKKITDTYDEILQIEPENYPALLGQALYYYKNNQKKLAQEKFSFLAQNVDTDSRLLMAAFDEYLSEKKNNDAVIIFTQLLQSNPENISLNFFAGMAFEAVENFKRAIGHYLKIPPTHSQYKPAILKIAYLYKDMNQHREATAFLEDKHRQHPEDIDIVAYLAAFYESDTRYEKAINLLEKTIEINPENTSLLFKLGAILDKAGYKEQSLETMEKILLIDPDDASALNYIGYSWAESDIRLEEALSLLKKAARLRPDDGYIIDSLGWVYYKLGEYVKAIKYLEKAAMLTSDETIICEHLGDAYVKADMPDKAIQAYEKSIANATDEDKEKIKGIKKKLETLKKNILSK